MTVYSKEQLTGSIAYGSDHSNEPIMAVLPENDPGLGERIVNFRLGTSMLVLSSQSD